MLSEAVEQERRCRGLDLSWDFHIYSSSFNCWINARFFASTSDSTFLDFVMVGFAMFLVSSFSLINGLIMVHVGFELTTPLDFSFSNLNHR